MNSVEIVI